MYVISAFIVISILLYIIASMDLSSALSSPIKQFAVILFSAAFVSYTHEKVLGDYYKQQTKEMNEQFVTKTGEIVKTHIETMEMGLSNKIINIVPDVERTLEDINKQISGSINSMITGMEILAGAKTSGIVNIFPTRSEPNLGKSFFDVVSDEISIEETKIRIMGISLGDYFPDGGRLHNKLHSILEDQNKAKLEIQVLFINPECDALKMRAGFESKSHYAYSSTYLGAVGTAKISKELCKNYKNLKCKIYQEPPLAYVLLTSRFAFIEPYNYAGRGSNVPIVQVQEGSYIYKSYSNHFDNIWEKSKNIFEYQPTPLNQEHLE